MYWQVVRHPFDLCAPLCGRVKHAPEDFRSLDKVVTVNLEELVLNLSDNMLLCLSIGISTTVKRTHKENDHRVISEVKGVVAFNGFSDRCERQL